MQNEFDRAIPAFEKAIRLKLILKSGTLLTIQWAEFFGSPSETFSLTEKTVWRK